MENNMDFKEYIKGKLIKEDKQIDLECGCGWKNTVHRSIDIPHECPKCHNHNVRRLYKRAE
jgi:hypothetical protein